jgi:transcription-repair coupling factor (superfamily II helicase)
VGFETYCRLLDETMRQLSGEKVEEPQRTVLKLHLDIHIPTDYIADEAQRLRAYKRLAGIADDADAERIESELRDRYGRPPQAVRNLIGYALLKSRAEALRIESIERRRSAWLVRFREDSRVDPRKLMEFVARNPGSTFSPQGELKWLREGAPEEMLQTWKGLFEEWSAHSAN